MTDRLIVSADDIGLSTTNTATIFKSVDEGTITSVSLLANGYAFDDAVAGYHIRQEKLRVAAHLNLTEGKALLSHDEVPRITTTEGYFKYAPLTLWMLYNFSLKKDRAAFRVQVKKELTAQIQKVKTALKSQHLAVDGHQHVHMIPFVFDVIAELAPEQGITEVRIPDEPFHMANVPVSRYSIAHIVGVLVFSMLAPRARRTATRAGMRINDAFAGLLFSGHMCKATAEAGLRAVLNSHPTRTEILFHPGSAGHEELAFWKGNTTWHYDDARRVEYEFVTSEHAQNLFTAFRNNTLSAGPDLPKVFRYLVAGSMAAFTHLGALYFFTEHTSLWYVHANVVAFGLGLMVSFILQKFWTFADRRTDRIHHQALIYTVMQVVSLGINTGGLYLLVQYAHMWYLLAEFILLVLVAVGNFFISSKVIFKKHGHA